MNTIDTIIDKHILADQTDLVNLLLDDQVGINVDHIENRMLPDPDCDVGGQIERDIFSWWLVTDNLATVLIKLNEPVIACGYGNWWGRVWDNFELADDPTLKTIAARYADKF